jgi:hypothetical protein
MRAILIRSGRSVPAMTLNAAGPARRSGRLAAGFRAEPQTHDRPHSVNKEHPTVHPERRFFAGDSAIGRGRRRRPDQTILACSSELASKRGETRVIRMWRCADVVRNAQLVPDGDDVLDVPDGLDDVYADLVVVRGPA